MWDFLKKHRAVALYVLFGGLTTLVDFTVTFLLYWLWGDAIQGCRPLIHGANAIAWTAAVTFAYATNRVWVFQSRRRGFLPILGEYLAFAGGRLMTFALQEAFVFVLFDWLGVNKYGVKIAASVLVLIGNYFISKFLVFRRKRGE